MSQRDMATSIVGSIPDETSPHIGKLQTKAERSTDETLCEIRAEINVVFGGSARGEEGGQRCFGKR